MIKKLTNKDEEFYNYMGRFFGSRQIEKQLNDRIYDDDTKEWYISIENEKVTAFASINNNVIKNIYAVKEKSLETVLNRIAKEKPITYSIVTKQYIEIYEKCGYKISDSTGYKNFIMIYIQEKENSSKTKGKKKAK